MLLGMICFGSGWFYDDGGTGRDGMRRDGMGREGTGRLYSDGMGVLRLR